MITVIYIVTLGVVGAVVMLALVSFGHVDAVLDRSELVAYGVGGALFGSLMGGLLVWAVQGRRAD